MVTKCKINYRYCVLTYFQGFRSNCTSRCNCFSSAKAGEKGKAAVSKFPEAPFIKAADELREITTTRTCDPTPFVLAMHRLREEREQSPRVKKLFETPLLKAILDLESAHSHD